MTLQTLIMKAQVVGNYNIVSYLEKILSEGKQSIVIDNNDKFIIDNGIDKFLKNNTFCYNWPEVNVFQAYFEEDVEETLLRMGY